MTASHARAAVLAALTLGAACTVGTRVRTFRPAQSPAGAAATLELRGERLRGELLALDDSALFVLAAGGVTLVRYTAILGATFAQVGSPLGGGHAPRPQAREQLRLVSRFPQGLTPELLRALLAAHAQAVLVVR